MDVPRRRGRPPGSKNKPNPKVVSELPPAVAVAVRAAREPDLTKPLPGTNMYFPGLQSASTQIDIHVSYQSAMGSGATWEEDAVWPSEWPLPKQGQRIKINERAGTVNNLTFDLDRRRISIALS